MSVRIRDYLGHVPRRRAPDLHPTPMHNPRTFLRAHPSSLALGRAGQKGARLQPLTSEFSGYFRARRAPNDLRVPSDTSRGCRGWVWATLAASVDLEIASCFSYTSVRAHTDDREGAGRGRRKEERRQNEREREREKLFLHPRGDTASFARHPVFGLSLPA